MVMIIHFVDMERFADENNVEVLIKEHFWGFVPPKEMTGALMTETILEELETMSLSVENLHGQGYDNGSNMKGKDNGVQSIYDALIEISDDTTFTGPSGNMARSDAEALANYLSKIRFVTSPILWYNILFEINLTSKQLQEKNLNIHSAIQKLQQTKNILEEFRSYEGFERTLVDSLKLAEEINFPTEFEPEPVCIQQKNSSCHMKDETHPFRTQTKVQSEFLLHSP
ncbi:zinc finger MYM-type containing 1 [Chelydra serpentina]|uniref:Zinc finger MYM-type containing 1 n=1 Tax=Chelydra serpentina TaxID=8475 RepID=A0A8T1SXW2_CHESE|nr:zinc finger MYM-type containing 1 [Chelydra serpentina]